MIVEMHQGDVQFFDEHGPNRILLEAHHGTIGMQWPSTFKYCGIMYKFESNMVRDAFTSHLGGLAVYVRVQPINIPLEA